MSLYRVVKRDITETIYEVEVDDMDKAVRAAAERWSDAAKELGTRCITEWRVEVEQ